MSKAEAPTDESVAQRIISGQCSFGPDDLDKHKCQALRQRWYIGPVRSGRKKIDTIIYLDEWYHCTCLCHIPENERPKKRARRTPAKKVVNRNTRKKKT